MAAAYLYLRQPERAAQLYEQLIQRSYLREDAGIRRNQDHGLLFAYADQGAVGTAQQLAPVLAQHYAPWRYVEGDAQKIPNAPYLDAIHTSTLMDLYANATPNAQHRLKHMVRTAPANNNLRTDLAQLYRIRGWPRLAEQELKIAEAALHAHTAWKWNRA